MNETSRATLELYRKAREEIRAYRVKAMEAVDAWVFGLGPRPPASDILERASQSLSELYCKVNHHPQEMAESERVILRSILIKIDPEGGWKKEIKISNGYAD
jgi:hypothetical protein